MLATQLPGRVSGVVLRGSAPHPRSLGADASLAEALGLRLHVVLDDGVAPYGAPDGAGLPETRGLWEAWLRTAWRGPLSVRVAGGELEAALCVALDDALAR